MSVGGSSGTKICKSGGCGTCPGATIGDRGNSRNIRSITSNIAGDLCAGVSVGGSSGTKICKSGGCGTCPGAAISNPGNSRNIRSIARNIASDLSAGMSMRCSGCTN